jgi:hypothetical protein
MMNLATLQRESPDREMRGGSEPGVLDHYDRTKVKTKGVRFPFLAAKIYGHNPMNAFLPPPLNANETGNTKEQDIKGQNVRPHHPPQKNTVLVQYGGTGGALDSVMRQYATALNQAGEQRLPTLGAEIYNAPSVKNPRAGVTPYDVANLIKNRSGMVGRIYSNATTVLESQPGAPTSAPVATKSHEQAATFGAMFKNWVITGQFK